MLIAAIRAHNLRLTKKYVAIAREIQYKRGIDQMIDEAEIHYSNTRQLQVKNLEEQLRSVSDALARIEELE
mgnify:CR=1 FL=1